MRLIKLSWVWLVLLPLPLSAQISSLAPLPVHPAQVLTPVQNTVQPLLAQTQQVVSQLDGLPLRNEVRYTSGQGALYEVEVRPGVRAVEREWLITVLPTLTSQFPADQMVVLDRQHLDKLGFDIVRVKVADSIDDAQKLQQLLGKDQPVHIERNYIYVAQQERQQQAPPPATTAERGVDTPPFCQPAHKLGVLDTAVETNHPALQQTHFSQQSFLEDLPSTPAHGTAVVGVVVGEASGLSPRLSNADVAIAATFYTRADGSVAATLQHLLLGLNWLAGEQVAVINMSLSGPAHPLLEQAIHALDHQGISLVAAAGNQGPHAEPVFPAAYPAVVAVTAVDSRQQIYRWANQGDYIDIAAFGVSVLTTRMGGVLGKETGTSMAAPIVAAALLCAHNQGLQSNERERWLQQHVKDIGSSGKDPVFGWGLLHYAATH